MSTKFLRTLRLLAGLGIIAFLIYRSDSPDVIKALGTSFQHPGWLASGLVFTFLGLSFGVVRWKEILAVQRLKLPFGQVFRVFFIGQFFNSFMPGACGGDVARAYYVVRETHPGRRTEAVSTVFVDRAIGLFATIACGCVMIALRVRFFLRNEQTQEAGLLMIIFLLGTLLALLVLFRRNLFEHWAFFRRLENTARLGALIRRAYEAFYLYRHHPGVVLIAILLSLLNLLFLTLACFSFGRSLQIEASLADYFTLFPMITTLAAIPLTPGALGIREGLFVAMFGWVGVEDSQAILMSLMVYASGLLCSLMGGIFFIGYSSEAQAILRERINPGDSRPSGP